MQVSIASDDFNQSIFIASRLRRAGISTWMIFGGKVKNQIGRSPKDTRWLVIIENGSIKLRNSFNKRQAEITAQEVVDGLLDLYLDDYSDGPEYMQPLYTSWEDLK